MLSHKSIWDAIDAIAARNDLTSSGLARKAGLDPTTFNRSKRIANDGRERWPSTESISKVLDATNSSIDEFMLFIRGSDISLNRVRPNRTIPLLGWAQAGKGGFFDDSGFPYGQSWDEIEFPTEDDEPVYALEITGDSMLPLYQDGDRIIICPSAQIRRGDRVVVKTIEGEVMAKVMHRRTAKIIELMSLNPEHKNITLTVEEIDWIARILWVSQ